MGELIREIRPYFFRIDTVGGNPMLLKLDKETLDISPNTTRHRSPGDYLTMMSNVAVPDCAKAGSNLEATEAGRDNRE